MPPPHRAEAFPSPK